MIEVMEEGRGAEAPRLPEQPQEGGRHFTEKCGELDRVLPNAGQPLGRVVDQLLKRRGLVDLGPLGLAAAMHLFDEDAKAFGGAGVARAQASALPGSRRALQEPGTCLL